MPHLQKARSEFILAIRKAKAAGVDVAGIFVEVEEYIILAWVKAFGLTLSIISVFASPPAVVWLKIFCAQNHLDIPVPEWAFWAFCLMGTTSILAFGFDLFDPRELIGKKPPDKCDGYISNSGRFRSYKDEENYDDAPE